MPAVAFPIVTPRLHLRPFTPADVPAMRAVYEDPRAMRYVASGAFDSPSLTEAAVREYTEHQRLHGFAGWAVVERESGVVIGDAGLHALPPPQTALELGYTLRPDLWGQGYATEAAAACIAQAFDVIGATEVVALVEPPNHASIRVAEKLGMVPDGTRMAYGREHLRFRLTR